jgi:hypothetical protein
MIATAQEPVRDTAAADPPRERLATLALWSDDVWLSLLDRDGSYFGRLAEEGTFQRFNPLMDDEYELDVWTGLFTGSEDARWAPVRNGFRAAGASVSHPHLLNVAEWRQDLAIAGAVLLRPRFLRQHSFTTRRDYASVAVEWQRFPGRDWSLRGGLGVHAFKASGDLELVLARHLGRGQRGLSGELRVAMLDAFNNVVFNLARGDPDQTPVHFRYGPLPRAARLDLEWTAPRARVELHAGTSTRSRVQVTFPGSDEEPFSQTEQLRYAGGLLEVALAPRLAVALFGTTARATSDRRYHQPSPTDFSLLEETSGLGARVTVGIGRTISAELDGRLLWRPERRVRGDGTQIRHADRELFTQLVLLRRVEVGWVGRLGIAYLDRRAGVLAPQLDASNARDLFEAGYRFRSGFELGFGLRWDLNGPGGFDGGHLRVTFSPPRSTRE